MSTENSATNGASFPRVSADDYGYAPQEVDAFIARARKSFASNETGPEAMTAEDIRSATFEPAKGGYDAAEVDEALDRLEQAFAGREESTVAVATVPPSQTAAARMDDDDVAAAPPAVTELPDDGEPLDFSDLVRGRLDRPRGERFRAPSNPGAMSYNRDDVDALCDRLVLNPRALDTQALRDVTFRVTRGDEGYEEAQVDAFLERVIQEIDGQL
ncbi:DivIVA domain-containing protein [Neomicrococcus lactis]|uniref:DivIVA domain-containing protein n=1 Tax=Neomicrococcus lactis TaxID=732241 RepID=A0A7W9DAX0_9MICC|nr:DivIVA domain-containing protein [Neomicrococcus lactis]